jgi:VIT1/CCC1 family predicted Fe2+/Mn2+ transporter
LTQDISAKKIDKYEFLGGEDTKFRVVEREGTKLKIWQDPSYTVLSDQLRKIGRLGFRELDKSRRLERERSAGYVSRFSMAMFGGAALIIPMLIMALHPGLTLDLVTTSVATVVFGIIIALLGTDSSGKDVLTSTAAYAAVLVVFVGASLSPTSEAAGQTS